MGLYNHDLEQLSSYQKKIFSIAINLTFLAFHVMFNQKYLGALLYQSSFLFNKS